MIPHPTRSPAPSEAREGDPLHLSPAANRPALRAAGGIVGVPLRVLSLGLGVQSTAVARMIDAGEFGDDVPDVAIFADTMGEPRYVYETLRQLQGHNSGIRTPIEIVSVGSLADQLLGTSQGLGQSDARPPFYVKNPDGTRGILRRQCTGDFKIDPIRKKIRELVGLRPGQSYRSHPTVKAAGLKRGESPPILAEQWICISLDEAVRMRDSAHAWLRNRYPLIEKRMTREDCKAWLAARGFDVPAKSACVFCPFRSDLEWIHLRDHDPEGFEIACRIDEALRSRDFIRIAGEAYLHSSLVPLRDVVLNATPRPAKWFQPDMWGNECEGMCGV